MQSKPCLQIVGNPRRSTLPLSLAYLLQEPGPREGEERELGQARAGITSEPGPSGQRPQNLPRAHFSLIIPPPFETRDGFILFAGDASD